MKIENHRFVGDPRVVDLSAKWAPNRKNPIKPNTICIHYDVCETIDGNTAAQFASGFYYHAAIDGADHDQKLPQVRQYVPFNLQGSHAQGLNATTLGLVIVNPGPLIRCSDGKLRTTYNEAAFRRGNLKAPTWNEDHAIEARHPHKNAPKNWTHWASYSHEERDTALEICELWIEEYPSIKQICGHEFLSPGRKFDPGPAAQDAIMAPLRGAFPWIHVPSYPEQPTP
jgi:N-acetylmuramoyl-L-alanine amidase